MLKRRSNPKQPGAQIPAGSERSLAQAGMPAHPPDAMPPAGTGGSALRKWLFRGIALVLFPLLMLGLAEGGLRLFEYGHSTSFFKKALILGREVFVENDKFGLRFFAPELARTPAPVVMEAVKKPGTCRIFLMGESAALGDPRPAYGMGRYLQVLLQERFPETHFEVVCVAMTAINSHAILPIARDCARRQGDLWLIYMGNNEMVGPFGAATVFGRQVPSLVSIRLSLALRSMRLGQLIESWIGNWLSKSAGPWGGMRMFTEHQVAADDPRRQIAHRHFARNLDDILNLARRTGCPVVLSTVAANIRDCAPFASVHSAAVKSSLKAEFDAFCQTAATHMNAGDLDAALENYQRARNLDPMFAEASFQLGQCHLRQTNLVQAKKAFIEACDNDGLPFRVDSTINDLIRAAAKRRQGPNVRLIDAGQALARQTLDEAPGAEFFFEHVHFNFSGNYQMAKALAEAIEPMLTPAIAQRKTPAWASQETCERQLGLTDWNRAGVLEEVLRRLQVAPFTQQANHQSQLQMWLDKLKTTKSRLTPERAAEAQAIYQEALSRQPQDHRLYEGYGEFLEATGRIEPAILQWQSVCRLIPHHFAAYVHTGRLLAQQQDWNRAEESLRTALSLEPRSAEAHLELGRVLAGQGKPDQAVDEYRTALHWQPWNAMIYFHLANAVAQQGNRGAAVELLKKAIKIQPSLWEARYLLGVELAMNEQIAEARKEFEEVLRLRPNHVLAHLNLGVALIREGRVGEASAEFEETLRLDPQNTKARQHLDTIQKMIREPESGRAMFPK